MTVWEYQATDGLRRRIKKLGLLARRNDDMLSPDDIAEAAHLCDLIEKFDPKTRASFRGHTLEQAAARIDMQNTIDAMLIIARGGRSL